MDGTDETTMSGPESFGDERLLSYALGLDPDAALEEALRDDADLRARLEAVRADIGVVAQGLERIVPSPPQDYTDLSGDRWPQLKPLLRAPAPRRVRRRSWLRVLAPVAAVALVLGVGVVAFERSQSGTGSMATDSTAAKNAQGEAAPAGSGDGGLSATAGAQEATREATLAADYRIVVVATARPAAGDTQVFEVQRVLKGRAPQELTLTADAGAASAGDSVILYLRPSSPPSGQVGATPSSADFAQGSFAYTYQGSQSIAIPLPEGTDPGSVTLP